MELQSMSGVGVTTDITAGSPMSAFRRLFQQPRLKADIAQITHLIHYSPELNQQLRGNRDGSWNQTAGKNRLTQMGRNV